MSDRKHSPLDPRLAGRTDHAGHRWRVCPACNYDLRGAPERSCCSECGLPIEIPIGKIDDALSLMPMSVIKRFRLGAWTSIVGMLLLALGVLYLFQWNYPILAGSFTLAGYGFWLCGAWFLTPELKLPQGAWRGFTGTSRIRMLGRWLQVAWLPFGGLILCALIATQSGAVPKWAESFVIYWWIVMLLTLLTSLIGLLFEGILLCELADWVRDRFAKQCLGVGLVGLIITSLAILIGNTFAPIVAFALMIWFVSAGSFGLGFILLGMAISHSVRHAREHQGRIRRRRERSDQFYGGMIDRIRKADAASEQIDREE